MTRAGGEAVTTATRPTAQDIRSVLEGVPDPEMPPVSIVDLGMLVDVRVDGGRVEVDLVPTYSGCPALTVIRQDVVEAVSAVGAVDEVVVRFVSDVVWEPARISTEGRRRLAEFGIAHPGEPRAGLLQVGGVTCPLCGSRDTVADSPFGPTPCRSSHYCRACRNPFELIKP